LLAAAPAVSAPAGELQYPATGFWNGYLSQQNVLECSNFGSVPVELNVKVFDSTGTQRAAELLRIAGFASAHLILNSLTSVVDSYGTYSLSAADNETLARVRCATSFYRFSSEPGRQVDYAYALPVENALRGTTSGLFNSMNPDGAIEPIYNWLTLFNPGDQTFRARVKLYRPDGTQFDDLSIELGAGERRDLAVGHNDPLNGGQSTGMYEIVPESASRDYFASLIRYGTRGSKFLFAFPLVPAAGSDQRRIALAATVNNALNWAEIANVAASPLPVTVRVLDRNGLLLSTENRTIPARGQSHVFVNASLGQNNVGSVEVVPNTAGGALLLQNMFYGRATDGKLLWAYGTQDLSTRGGPEVRLGFPTNTFLGMANWMRLKNGDTSARAVRIESFSSDGSRAREETLPVPASGGLDVALHERLGASNVGLTFVSATDQTSGLEAELLRVFLGSAGQVQSVMYVPPFSVPEAAVPIELEKVGENLSSPVAVTRANDSSGRLFICEREGRVKILKNGAILSQPFLDISAKVTTDGEMGLLSIAFSPQYSADKKFYVVYSALNYDTVLSEFSRDASDADAADALSEREILRIPQPHIFHKGGQIVFGPDGYLYMSTGDGGFSGDPLRNGQNLSVPLGKIFRLDLSVFPYRIPTDNPFVGVSGALGEIWAYGFRNPWRFSFDRLTGELFAGDVGEGLVEEVDIVQKGLNYGWSSWEGFHCFRPEEGCSTTGVTFPITEYYHPEGLAIVGGGVYRGPSIAGLTGKYLFADYVSGRIWALEKSDRNVWSRSQLLRPDFYISAFGEDQDGEMYVVNFFGELYRIKQPS